jgi:hypothetical protein
LIRREGASMIPASFLAPRFWGNAVASFVPPARKTTDVVAGCLECGLDPRQCKMEPGAAFLGKGDGQHA